ncbi:MAG: transglycosylase domain-containing protein [Kofleriaceae bacterium]
MIMRRDRRILVVTAVLAVGVPLGAHGWIGARTDALAGRVGAAGGVPATIGDVDAELTGAIRFSKVGIGQLFFAEAIEASVSLGSLLEGRFGADEIRVSSPRVALHIERDGDSNLARLARRLVVDRGGQAVPRTRVRRIVVGSGSLTANVAGLGRISASQVELLPDPTGVRVITGPVTIRGGAGAWYLRLEFSRSAADLALPKLGFGRVLAVGGTGSLTLGTTVTELRDVAAGRISTDGALEVRGHVNDDGIARELSVEADLAEQAIAITGDRVPLRGLARLAPRSLGLESARITGTAHARRVGDQVNVTARGSIDGLVVEHPTLAVEPVPIAGTIELDVGIGDEALAVRRLELGSGAIQARLTGWLRRTTPIAAQVTGELGVARCAELFAAIPEQLRGPLDGLVLDGSIGGRARLSIDLAAPSGDGVALTTDLDGGCKVIAEPPGADVTELTGTFEHVHADGSRARLGPGEPGWVDDDELSPRIRGAFVAAEDGRFYRHHGFDLEQIARSLEIDLREHRLARGGSTISQQLIKNTFLSHRRTLDRKIQEAILTWRLEAKLGKRKILERYLNIIELGPHVFGIGAAARHWFDATPKQLSNRQLAFLAAMTSEPQSMTRRVQRLGGLDPESAERVATVLRAMRRDGVIDEAAYNRAKTAEMGFTTTALKVLGTDALVR